MTSTEQTIAGMTIDDLLDHLSRAFTDAAAETEATLREELEADGYVFDDVVVRGEAHIASLQEDARQQQRGVS